MNGGCILARGEVAERLMAALLKSAESKDFVGSNPTLSASGVGKHSKDVDRAADRKGGVAP
jgi:hypothetical protein